MNKMCDRVAVLKALVAVLKVKISTSLILWKR